jgi:hypothetical protein
MFENKDSVKKETALTSRERQAFISLQIFLDETIAMLLDDVIYLYLLMMLQMLCGVRHTDGYEFEECVRYFRSLLKQSCRVNLKITTFWGCVSVVW